jgi:hypothetical protein
MQRLKIDLDFPVRKSATSRVEVPVWHREHRLGLHPFLLLVGLRFLLLDQTHAGQPGFGLLKLRNINLDQVKPTLTEHFGRSRIAGGKDQTTADAESIGGSRLALINGNGINRRKLRGIDAGRMIKQDGDASSIKAGECRTGLQVQAASQLGPNNIEANSPGDCAKIPYAVFIRSARQSHIEGLPDAKDVSAVQETVADAVKIEMSR